MKPLTSFILQWLYPCLLLGLFSPGPVFAQMANAPATTSNNPPAYVVQARKTIDAVLDEPEFDRTLITKVPRVKELPDNESTTDGKKNFLERFIEWLFGDQEDKPGNDSQSKSKPRNDSRAGSLDVSLAQSGQIILWLLVFGLVALLLINAKHWLPFFGWRPSRAASPSPVQQIDSALEFAEELPEDIATAAERCWKEGKREDALSLLYRGTIELLTEHHRIDLPQSATEGEIRLLIDSVMPSFKDDFVNIARAWLRLAYAHRPPADIIDLLARFSRLQQAGRTVS